MSISEEIRLLYQRLDKGDDEIAALEKAGKPVPDKWLNRWLALLGEYERKVRAARQERGE